MAQPTILDQSQPYSDQEDHAEPYAKRQRVCPDDNSDDKRVPANINVENASGRVPERENLEKEVPPMEFMAMWVKSKQHGIVPFVKSMDSGLIHCGLSRMKMVTYKSQPDSGRDHTLILCLSGCEDGYCGGPDVCKRGCHILQADYDLRNYDNSL